MKKLFYFKDKYDREPIQKLIEVFIIGAVVVLQIQYLQDWLLYFSTSIIFQSFIVAGLVEEAVKFVALKYTIFRDKEFNEQVDGIVYAVFLGLGFALVETFVLSTNYTTDIVRSVTAIPAHALFACVMGYYLGKFKFHKKWHILFFALVIPAFSHGLYDYFIMCNYQWGLFLFVPYLVVLWIVGIRDTELLLDNSRFKKRVEK